LRVPSVTRRLILVRHGPSAHVHGGGWLDRRGVQRWRDAYDSAGIQDDCRPPEALVQLAADATHIVASDLPRAIASAERVARARAIRVSELLREMPLAIPLWPTRLPFMIWDVLISARGIAQVLRGLEATGEDRARARAAIAWLEEFVDDGSTALVVTHGVFRRVLSTELRSAGWTRAGRRGGYRHWSTWSFVRTKALA
jgi:broad specificity phosphatase PhoE